MSLTVLQSKTKAMQNISRNGFSSAGTIRGLNPTGKGYSISTTRTPMKGTVAIGHGGCCGQYVQSLLSVDRKCSPALGKPSISYRAVNNIATRHLNWNADRQSLSFEDRLRRLRVAASCLRSWEKKPNKTFDEGCCRPARIGGVLFNRSTFYHEEPGAMGCSEYTSTDLYRNQCLPPPPCKAPFPTPVKPIECARHALTPEQAIAIGLLQSDWGRCRGSTPAATKYATNPYAT